MVKPATDTPTTLEAGTAHHKIRSMAVAGGFLDGARPLRRMQWLHARARAQQPGDE